MMKKIRCKYYNKRIITPNDANVQGLFESELKDVAIGLTFKQIDEI